LLQGKLERSQKDPNLAIVKSRVHLALRSPM